MAEEKNTRLFITLMSIDLAFTSIHEAFARVEGSFSRQIVEWFKVRVLIEVLFFLYILASSKKIRIYKPLSLLFLVGFGTGCVVGLLNGQVNSHFLLHAYSYAMPILMLGLSWFLIEGFDKCPGIKSQLDKMVIFNVCIYIVCVVVFRIMCTKGLTNYNAYGAGTMYFLMPYLLFAMDLPILNLFAILACILCGKRSVLVVTMLLVFLFYTRKERSKNRRLFDWLLLILGSVGLYVVYLKTNYFARIVLTIENLIGSNKNFEVASGGRASEIELVFNLLNTNIVNWLVGHGFGVFVVLRYDSGTVVRGYSHLAPLGYVMVVGVFFAVALYSYLFIRGLKLCCKRGKYYRMFGVYLLGFLLSSMFGASIISEPKYWIIIGMAYWYEKKKERKNECINLYEKMEQGVFRTVGKEYLS